MASAPWKNWYSAALGRPVIADRRLQANDVQMIMVWIIQLSRYNLLFVYYGNIFNINSMTTAQIMRSLISNMSTYYVTKTSYADVFRYCLYKIL